VPKHPATVWTNETAHGDGFGQPWRWRDLAQYALAVGAIAFATALTRVTWPLLARSPFVALFAVIFITARWLPERTSLFAIGVAALAATVMAPGGGAAPPEPWMIAGFVGVSFVGNRIVVGRNRLEAALRASEAQFRAAWENVAFGAALLTTRGNVQRINPAMQQLLGYTSPAWTGVSFAYFGLGDVEDDRSRFAALMKGSERSYQREQGYRRADGTVIWCRVTMSVIADARGQAAGALMVLEDVTQRRRMEDTLRASEFHYRQLFQDNPQAMWVYALDDERFLAVNETALARYGYTSDEFLELSRRDLIVRDVPSSGETLSTNRHPEPGTGRHRTKDGRVLDVQIDSSFVQWDGRTARLELVHDVTERTQLREQLGQAQKMEAIGQLAGGLAHDFNNLLTTIQGYTELVLMQIGSDKPIWRDLHEIHAASRRAGILTSQLLAFSRSQPPDITVIDVNERVARLAEMMRRILEEDIEVDVTLGHGHLHTRADASRLEQVLMNLIVNARDALQGPGGRISIRTRRARDQVVLEVADNGRGMDAATKARVFEPFFTTKEAGAGTGLGLAMVYGIVQQCGGHVEVESELGHGSTFRVYLPWTDEPLQRDSRSLTVTAAFVGSERVLIVEDSFELRMLVSQVLTRYGYRVSDAGSPDEALALAHQPAVTIDLVLMDAVMPRLTGPQIAPHLRAAWPNAAVLYMSGYSPEALASRNIHIDAAAVLRKPFSTVELLTRMREMLDRPAVADV